MIEALKSSTVIAVIGFAVLLVLRAMVSPVYRNSFPPLFALAVLGPVVFCIPNTLAAFAILIVLTVASNSGRASYGSGVIFALISLPAITLQTAAGGIPLLVLSTENILIVALLIVTITSGRMSISRLLAVSLPAGILFVLMLVGEARGTSWTNWLRVAVDLYLSIILVAVLVGSICKSREGMARLTLALVAAGCVVSAVALFESVKAWPVYQIYPQLHHIEMISGAKMRAGFLRAGGPLMNPPASAFILAICAGFALMGRKLFRTAGAYYAAAGLIVLGLMAMQSRGAWVGLVLIIVSFIMRTGSTQARLATLAGGTIAAGLVGIAATPGSFLGEVLGVTGDGAGSIDYRQRLFDRGVEVFWQHPLVGQSIRQVMLDMADLRQGEGIIDFVNWYLLVALTTGTVGLLLVLVAFALVLVQTGRYKSSGTLRAIEPGVGAGLTFAGCIPMLAFLSLGTRATILLVILLAIVATRLRPARQTGSFSFERVEPLQASLETRRSPVGNSALEDT